MVGAAFRGAASSGLITPIAPKTVRHGAANHLPLPVWARGQPRKKLGPERFLRLSPGCNAPEPRGTGCPIDDEFRVAASGRCDCEYPRAGNSGSLALGTLPPDVLGLAVNLRHFCIY